MPNSYADTTGNGVTTDFAIPFPYVSTAHVYVEVSGTNTAYTWVDPTTVRVSPAPAAATVVRRLRRTSQATRLVSFTGSTSLTPVNIDGGFIQAFYMAQEAIDRADTGTAATATVNAAIASITATANAAGVSATAAVATANAANATANTALTAALSASGGMAITGAVATMPRVAASGIAFEYRTPAQVAADIGAVSTVSPTFTGTPAAPTAAPGTNTTQLSTTAFVTAAIAAISYAAYAPLAGPTFTGVPAAPTAAPLTNTTQIATTAFVTAALAAFTTTPTMATQAQMEAATSTVVSVNPGNMIWHPAMPKAIYRGTISNATISGTFSSANSTTEVVTWSSAHGLASGDFIFTVNSGSNPNGWVQYQGYFVNVPSATTFTLHDTYADAIAGTSKVNLTTSGGSGWSAKKITITSTHSYNVTSVRPVGGSFSGIPAVLEVTFAVTLSAANTMLVDTPYLLDWSWTTDADTTTSFRMAYNGTTGQWGGYGAASSSLGFTLHGDVA